VGCAKQFGDVIKKRRHYVHADGDGVKAQRRLRFFDNRARGRLNVFVWVSVISAILLAVTSPKFSPRKCLAVGRQNIRHETPLTTARANHFAAAFT
jgi:hypothetical protein